MAGEVNEGLLPDLFAVPEEGADENDPLAVDFLLPPEGPESNAAEEEAIVQEPGEELDYKADEEARQTEYREWRESRKGVNDARASQG